RLDDRQGRAERAAGGDDDGVRLRRPLQHVVQRRGHRPVVVHERAVDVEADQQVLPGEAVEVLVQACAGRIAVGGGGGGGGGHGRQCGIAAGRAGERPVTKRLEQ